MSQKYLDDEPRLLVGSTVESQSVSSRLRRSSKLGGGERGERRENSSQM